MSRRTMTACLSASLWFATGCPEPSEEGGSSAADETGGADTGSNDTGFTTDVNPPPESGGDDEGTNTDTDDDDTGESDDDTGDDDGGGFDDPGRCWDAAWRGDELPVTIFDNTIGRNDDALGSCGLGDAPDYQLDFRAPRTGTFVFDTAGSSFDTVVFIEDGPCGSPELACNDDFVDLSSRAIVELEQGQKVTVHVDGTSPFELGPFKLNISELQPPSCEPILANPPYPKQFVDDTSLGTNELASSCGGFDSPEHVYEFLAQGPGIYRFSTAGSSFDTVLYWIDADEGCSGQPLDCNDDANFELQSELTVELDGGQRILVVVDGNDPDDFGAYELLAEKLD